MVGGRRCGPAVEPGSIGVSGFLSMLIFVLKGYILDVHVLDYDGSVPEGNPTTWTSNGAAGWTRVPSPSRSETIC